MASDTKPKERPTLADKLQAEVALRRTIEAARRKEPK